MSATKKGKPLEQLIAILPHIAIFSPQTGEYADLREIYAQDNPAVPLAIARPKNGNEVAQIVTQAVNLQIPFAIRSGGHDSWGRTMVQDALTIDMRDIYHVEVAASKQSARVGGGILMGSLLNELGKHELVTTFGAVPTIGYVGWATLGGYGIVSSQYGIGVDQIIAAKIVNAEGKIVNASAEVLKGIRGAGGNFGAIVELEIKVYPLGKVG
jgi:FAD/FMN-containing dehydrogenase